MILLLGYLPQDATASLNSSFFQTNTTESCLSCLQNNETDPISSNSNFNSYDELYAAAQDEVDEINTYIAENNLSWTAEINDVMLMTDEERQHLKGLKHRTNKSEVASESEETEIMADLPTSFDWRNNGGDFTTPVRNQGNCGSCWAFAVTGTFESYKEIKTASPGMNPDYAEQYLVSCAADQDGCGGGYFDSMSYFVNKAGSSGGTGTVLETNYPYTSGITGSSGSCKSLSSYTRYTVDTSAGENWGYVGGGNEWSIPSDDAIKSAIYQYGPVAAGVYADSAFDSYGSGILDSTTSIDYTNHAIVIVGWGTSNGRTYWIGKNSWGTGWGESGWFRIYSGRLRIGEGTVYFKHFAFQTPTITSITPSTGEQNSSVQITNLTGTNFASGATVVLNRAGYTNITATNISLVSSTRLTCTFNLNGVAAGTWNVGVINPSGKSALLNNAFTVTYPTPTIISITPNSGTKNSSVRITNLVGTHFQNGVSIVLNRTGYANVTATDVSLISSSRLNGTFNLNNVAVGTWNVGVINPSGKSAHLTNAFTVKNDLTARFYGVPSTTVYPLTIQFYDTSTGNPTARTWSFGDGTTSTQQNPTKTYNTAGNRTVTLTVTGSS